MAQQLNDSEPSTSSALSTGPSEVLSSFIRLPKVVLNRLDEKTILRLQTPTRSKKSNKRVTKVSFKLREAINKSPKVTNDSDVKRGRGRPKKIQDEPVLSKFKKISPKLELKAKKTNKKVPMSKKTHLEPGIQNKNASKEDGKLRSRPGRLLNKTMLQKRSKVVIPQAKKTKMSPNKVTKPKSPSELKPTPPKPKLEIIQTNPGENSSDTSGDEFLYDELIEELENTANKRVVNAKPAPEKTTITLKPNAGNKPPTVLKGGIVKRTDLPSELNLFASSNTKSTTVTSNGLQKKQPAFVTPSGKRKSSGIFLPSGVAKKSSPWPVLFTPPKKSPAKSFDSQKKKDLSTKVVSPLSVHPTTISPKNTNSPFIPSTETLPNPSSQTKSITLGMPKVKIGPKQTAKVVPLSKSFDADDYLSDEYLEEERLECDLEVIDQVPSENKDKSNIPPSNQSTARRLVQDANLDLLKILTDDSEEPIKANKNEAHKKPVLSKVSSPTNIKEKQLTTQFPMDTRLETPTHQTKDVENEEPPIRTIYDVMNEVFLEYPSWNLHIIPETSAFCIAQVTKGRLGLPTLKKCIELDAVNYKAKVYIHQYHIKRFDGVYDGEESILALIKEIDSIKA